MKTCVRCDKEVKEETHLYCEGCRGNIAGVLGKLILDLHDGDRDGAKAWLESITPKADGE